MSRVFLQKDVVFDCCVPLSSETVKKFGLVTTYSKFKHSTSDERLFEEFTKEGKTIVTKDAGFLIHALCNNTGIYYVGKNGHLYYVEGKAELVEAGFKYKFSDMITYSIHENDSVIFP